LEAKLMEKPRGFPVAPNVPECQNLVHGKPCLMFSQKVSPTPCVAIREGSFLCKFKCLTHRLLGSKVGEEVKSSHTKEVFDDGL